MPHSHSTAQLGDSKSLLRREHDYLDADPEPGEHINQAVNAEEVQAPPDELADPGLRHAKELGRFSLLEAPGLNRLLNLDKKVRSNPKVFGFLCGKAEVAKHVAG